MKNEKEKILRKATGSKLQRKKLKKEYRYTILKQKVGVRVASYISKLSDSPDTAKGSKIDEYWQNETIKLIAHNYFDKDRLPKALDPFSPESIVKFFGLRGIQFGNWLSQEDRYNYLFAIAASLYDMKVLLDLPYKKMGFNGKLTIALGARGSGTARAHFESGTFTINMTRYPRVIKDFFGRVVYKASNPADKIYMMLNAGGVGALSHEWMHALDYHQGKRGVFASGGRSVRWGNDYLLTKKATIESDYERLLAELNTDKEGDKSPWRIRLDKSLEDRKDLGEYFRRRLEIVARSFESYLALEMKNKGIRNLFISQPKYTHLVYPSSNMLRAIKPHFDAIIRKYRLEK